MVQWRLRPKFKGDDEERLLEMMVLWLGQTVAKASGRMTAEDSKKVKEKWPRVRDDQMRPSFKIEKRRKIQKILAFRPATFDPVSTA